MAIAHAYELGARRAVLEGGRLALAHYQEVIAFLEMVIGVSYGLGQGDEELRRKARELPKE